MQEVKQLITSKACSLVIGVVVCVDVDVVDVVMLVASADHVDRAPGEVIGFGLRQSSQGSEELVVLSLLRDQDHSCSDHIVSDVSDDFAGAVNGCSLHTDPVCLLDLRPLWWF